MRNGILILGLAIACGPSAWAGDAVHLNGPADLAQLRATNPKHYQQALKIMAAANQLCRPHAGEVEYTDAKDVSCTRMLLRTSNPPKRDLSFRLDNTTYIALVTLTDDPPRLVAATSR
jgi:hypothetical protein